MNKLEAIEAAVAAHHAAKEATERQWEAYKGSGIVTGFPTSYKSDADEPMTLLESVIPLLQEAVYAFDINESSDAIDLHRYLLNKEVLKLLMEVSP